MDREIHRLAISRDYNELADSIERYFHGIKDEITEQESFGFNEIRETMVQLHVALSVVIRIRSHLE